jgi:hypothetical protein
LNEGLAAQDRLKVIAFNMRIRQLTDFAPPSPRSTRHSPV